MYVAICFVPFVLMIGPKKISKLFLIISVCVQIDAIQILNRCQVVPSRKSTTAYKLNAKNAKKYLLLWMSKNMELIVEGLDVGMKKSAVIMKINK